MRIDSSGSVLVGTNTTGIAGGTAQGLNLHGQSGAIEASRNANTSLFLNRYTDDGKIAEFRRDGVDIGSISVGHSNLIIGTGTTGLRFWQNGPALIPRQPDNSTSDGVISLGWSGNKFKDLTLSGAITKGSGSFTIPHPLPSKTNTHNLVHSFVEAPQADNIYRGKVDLVSGSTTVNIDTVSGMTEGTFVALNREVQCFTTNESNWDSVKGSVSGNILTIESQNTESTATISWLVIGERQDQHMYDTDWTDENGKVIVEPLKIQEEVGP